MRDPLFFDFMIKCLDNNLEKRGLLMKEGKKLSMNAVLQRGTLLAFSDWQTLFNIPAGGLVGLPGGEVGENMQVMEIFEGTAAIVNTKPLETSANKTS